MEAQNGRKYAPVEIPPTPDPKFSERNPKRNKIPRTAFRKPRRRKNFCIIVLLTLDIGMKGWQRKD
jgi:hypothetical protein